MFPLRLWACSCASGTSTPAENGDKRPQAAALNAEEVEAVKLPDGYEASTRTWLGQPSPMS
jgi:hypothetical protein